MILLSQLTYDIADQRDVGQIGAVDLFLTVVNYLELRMNVLLHLLLVYSLNTFYLATWTCLDQFDVLLSVLSGNSLDLFWFHVTFVFNFLGYDHLGIHVLNWINCSLDLLVQAKTFFVQSNDISESGSLLPNRFEAYISSELLDYLF